MDGTYHIKEKLEHDGFAIVNDFYTDKELALLHLIIANGDSSRPTFRKTNDLFAIRQFLKELPQAAPIIFNKRFVAMLSVLFGEDYFVVKSIYFDKPAESNWFVSYHQDLTISVDKKIIVEGFGPWTTKQAQFAVQPPLPVLQDNFTVRIHLDETNEANGALKVIPTSHRKGIYRPETIDWSKEKESTCCVNQGGVMFMKPLLLHSSGRTTNNAKRRVVHIEFSKQILPNGLIGLKQC